MINFDKTIEFLRKYIKLEYIVIPIFVGLTILKLLHHVPWSDEAWAWVLAKNMNFSNALAILSMEGHFILWYLLILPFAKLNFHYPYSMFFINWLAYLIAIILMWRKAPFNNIIKLFITFSWVSLNYFPIVARCYSIGILGLFILAFLYSKQNKNPILYSVILVLTAHTSFIATLPVVPLALIFVYNLFKNKNNIQTKNIIYSMIILLLGVFLWFLPFVNGYGHSDMIWTQPGLMKIIDTCKPYFLYCYLLSLIMIFINADNKIRFLSLFTIITYLIFFSFIYPITPHLFLFLIIYLILFFWLTPKLHSINYKTLLIYIFLGVLLFTNEHRMGYILEFPNKQPIIQYITMQNKKGDIFIKFFNIDIIPYLPEYNTLVFAEDPAILKNDIENYWNWNKHVNRIYVISDRFINKNSKKIYVGKKTMTQPDEQYVTIFDRDNLSE